MTNISSVNANNASRHYWDKGKRLTISMWDYSWLMDQGKGGAFENIEQRVAEAAERGYNTLRVDCFPSRMLEKTTTFLQTTSSTPGYSSCRSGSLPGWGKVTTGFSCDILQKLKTLADACRKHNIWLGLDSWESGHMMGNKSDSWLTLYVESPIPVPMEEKAFRDLGHTWVKALRIMREEGILERAVWVAPMNEVPRYGSHCAESVRQISAHDKHEGNVELEKNQMENDRYKLINLWMGEEIKDEIKRENIPLSYSSNEAEQYAKRLPEIYDVVDVHFMPGLIMDQEENQQFAALTNGKDWKKDFIGFLDLEKMDFKRFSELWDRTCRRHYAEMLTRTRDYLNTALDNCTFPSGKRMQAVITESFGPVQWPDHPDVGWEWFKHYNGDSARIAAALPFEGISLSNHAEPIFSLWNDIDWHRNANLFILSLLEKKETP